jgi:hypothetical protein
MTSQHHSVWRQALAAVACSLTCMAASAQWQPIAAAGTEGVSFIAPGGDLYATYEGGGHDFDSTVYLLGYQMRTPMFNNFTSNVGDEVYLGNYEAGTELVFMARVNEYSGASLNYFSGAASRNADGMAHARIQPNWQNGATLVSFEDMFNNPEGLNGYNDFSFSLRAPSISAVPEPDSLAMLAAGAALLAMRRKARQAE